MRSVALASLALALVVGCKRPTREWRADDHDQEPSSPFQVAATGASAGGGGDEALVDATYRASCAVCHGIAGQGDGPQGPMVKAPDLSDPAFQAARTDEQIAAAIRGGKNRMPAFPQFPANVVGGLVKKVRSFKTP